MTSTVRERSKELLRVELAEAVYDYFAEHGFDATTVDQAAHGIGISRATFFRYFGSKEEAVIVAVHSSPIDFADALTALSSDMPLWARMRAMFDSSVTDVGRRPSALRARIRMINATPSLKSRLAERRVPQIESVAAVLRREGHDSSVAQALAATAFALFDAGWGEWVASTDADFASILDGLFALIGPRP